jgi:transposase InsO family protein
MHGSYCGRSRQGLFHGWISNFDLKLFGINKLNTTAYHPQTNEKLEREHRTLVPMLMSLCKRTDFKDWNIHLQKVVYILRIHDSEGIGTVVPIELIYGRMPRHPVDILSGSPMKVLEYLDRFKFT